VPTPHVTGPLPSQAELAKLRVAVSGNMALAHLKLRQWAQAAAKATDVLRVEPTNVKALCRRGNARLEMGLAAEARDDLTAAARLEPQNAEIRRDRERAVEAVKAEEAKARKAFGGIFARGGKSLYDDKKDVTGPPPRPAGPLPRVFFDVAIGGVPKGRIVMELYTHAVPRTAENFRVQRREGRRRCGQAAALQGLHVPPRHQELHDPGRRLHGEQSACGGGAREPRPPQTAHKLARIASSLCSAATARAASPSTARSSRMRPSTTRTTSRSCCPWPTPAATPTAASSSSPPCRRRTSTVSRAGRRGVRHPLTRALCGKV
jgi:hypothetical protein